MKPLQFTLRDLFWMVLLSGVIAGAWGQRSQQMDRLQRELDALTERNDFLEKEFADTTRAAQWAHVYCHENSDHLMVFSNAKAIELAGKRFSEQNPRLIGLTAQPSPVRRADTE